MNDPLLVAYYTSQLDKTSQVIIYSKFLEKIVLSEQRTRGLLAAEKFSLPVEEITKRIVETYRFILFFLSVRYFSTVITYTIFRTGPTCDLHTHFWSNV